MIRRRSHKKAILFWCIVLCLAAVEMLLTAAWLVAAVSPRVYSSVNDIPAREVGMVLGCSKYAFGRPSAHFDARIRAAARLYQAGKVRKLVLSGGADSWDYYDETTDMRRDLMALGVHEEDILLDPKGLRTLDSIIRMRNVFHLDDFITISQGDHCRRALFLADHNGISTIGFDAGIMPGGTPAALLHSAVREPMARVKAIADVLFHTTAKFEY